MDPLSIFLGVGLILVFGFIAEFVFKKSGVPDVLFLILLGFVIGPFGFKLIRPDTLAPVAPFFVTFALLFLLFDGAFDIDLASLTKGLSAGLWISIFNFVTATAIVTIIMLIIGFNFLTALLLGIILADISELFVIPILKKMKVKAETYTILTFESALTDVLCIVFALTVMQITALGSVTLQGVLGTISSLFAVAGLVGIIGGIIWIILVVKVLKEHKSYMMTLAFMLILYVLTEWLNGNGAIAALFFGIILANSKQLTSIIHGIATLDKKERQDALDGKYGVTVTSPEEKMFYEQVSFFLKVFFFVYIGILLDISSYQAVIIGVLLTISLMLTRDTSLIVTKGMDKFSRELISSIFGKGLGAAAVVIIAQNYNVPYTDFLAKVVYVVIFLSIALSSMRLYLLKRKYGA
ncbi:MAG: cation:proton antiporter [Nanoarchaeota archaeon]